MDDRCPDAQHTPVSGSEEEFLTRYPYEQNVFVMMRYRDDHYFRQIEAALNRSLQALGLRPHYAKDRAYEQLLWENVQVYMHCCKYGIAVFEQIDERDFNPNISIELGYMIGQNRKCLLLKERRMPVLPTDICGYIYRNFDVFNILQSIKVAVDEWVRRDLGITPLTEFLRRRVHRIAENRDRESRSSLKILWALHGVPEGLTFDRIYEAVTARPSWRSAEGGNWLRRLLVSLCDQGLLQAQRREGDHPLYSLTTPVRDNLTSWLEVDA